MKIRLKYAIGKTINLGNYQSARVDIGIEVEDELLPGESMAPLYEVARTQARERMKEAIVNKDWE